MTGSITDPQAAYLAGQHLADLAARAEAAEARADSLEAAVDQARADQAAAAAKAAAQVAYGGTTDGSVIFGNLCTGCHTSGAGGAPTLDRAHWASRIPQGTDVLHKHAIEGYTGPDGGEMPARGGNPALTDAQVIATVDWMLQNLK